MEFGGEKEEKGRGRKEIVVWWGVPLTVAIAHKVLYGVRF
jgi:hypothetical protein